MGILDRLFGRKKKAEGTKMEKPKIKHLLVLVSNKPPEGNTYFFKQLLNNLYCEGWPLLQFIDEKTKMAVNVVGEDFDFDDIESKYFTAMIVFPQAFGQEPISDNLSFQTFHTTFGSGSTIEEWNRLLGVNLRR